MMKRFKNKERRCTIYKITILEITNSKFQTELTTLSKFQTLTKFYKIKNPKFQYGIWDFFMFYFLKTLAKIQIIIAMIKITINIPNPIPALKMSPITSQLVNENSITNTINNLSILFCMILSF